MNGHITHLHHHYQLAVGASTASATVARLDRLVHEHLRRALGAALDQALGDDPTVYVLRQVDAPLALTLRADLPDTQVVQRWAERLGGAIVRQIARTPNDGANQIRFADQADYVTHYVTDLLRGQAAQQWYYHTFARYRDQPALAAVSAVLLDHRAELPAILRNLHERGALEQLLTKLDPATLQTLWREGLGDQAGVEPAAIYPLFARTLTLVDRLDLWRQTAPDMAALLPTYLAAGITTVDWRDRTALTNLVIDVLNFLSRQGYLQQRQSEDAPTFLAHVNQVLNDFDWLDPEHLRAALLALRSAPARFDQLAQSTNQNITPRQRTLVNDLLTTLTNTSFSLDPGQMDSVANRLRLYTILLTAAPHWADDPLATGLIRQLLRACSWVSQCANPDKVLQHLRRRDIAEAQRALPMARQAEVVSVLGSLAALQEPGLKLIERLIGPQRFETSPTQQMSALAPLTHHPHITTALNLLTKLDKVSLAVVLVAGTGELSDQLVQQMAEALPVFAHRQTADALKRLVSMDGVSRQMIQAFLRKDLTESALDAALSQLRPQQRTTMAETIALLDNLDNSSLSFIQTLVGYDRSPSALEQLLQMLPDTNRTKAEAALQLLARFDAPSLRQVKELMHNADPTRVIAKQGIQTECAGVYLLLRAIGDVQLPGLASRTNYPPHGQPSSLGLLLVALGLRCAGAPGVNDDEPDLGLGFLAMDIQTPTLADLRAAWGTREAVDHEGGDWRHHLHFQTALLRRLAGLRLVDSALLHLHQLTLADGQRALIAGDASGTLWPFGCMLDEAMTLAEIVVAWLENWQTVTGHRPQLVLSADLATELGELPDVVMLCVESAALTGDNELTVVYFAGREALVSTLAAMEHGQLRLPDVDLTIALTAIALLRAWARWLPHFANSSIPYLLTHFVRRSGWVTLNDRTLLVEMATMPLDMVLTMAGYTATMEKVSWLDKRDIQFVLRDG